jgi:NADPH:quinone reductase-like Zn-dependent oxidoreductase
MAARFGASVILGTSRSQEKLEVLRTFLSPLSCEFIGVDTSHNDFAVVAGRETRSRGIDVVVDNVGASVLEGNIAAAAIGGRIVQVGRLGGRKASIDLDEVARKRIALIGVTFRTRSQADKVDVVNRFLADVPDASGLGPRVDTTFPLAEAEAAQDALARDAHVGKLVLIP